MRQRICNFTIIPISDAVELIVATARLSLVALLWSGTLWNVPYSTKNVHVRLTVMADKICILKTGSDPYHLTTLIYSVLHECSYYFFAHMMFLAFQFLVWILVKLPKIKGAYVSFKCNALSYCQPIVHYTIAYMSTYFWLSNCLVDCHPLMVQ